MANDGFTNHTELIANALLLHDEHGAVSLTWIAKQSYSISIASGVLEVAAEQSPIRLADVYRDDPASSSLLYPSDAVVLKDATDVIVLASAVPAQPPAPSCDVELCVDKLRHRLRVFGNRRWVRAGEALVISDPEPFEHMPICFERAFGGSDLSASDSTQDGGPQGDPRNPVGVGFWQPSVEPSSPELAAAARERVLAVRTDTPLPNIENPESLIERADDQPEPAGFGAVAPHWQPRAGLAGTFDEPWRKLRCPLLPEDFDRRYFNAAVAPLQLEGALQGGEAVSLTGAHADGPIRFRLPLVELLARSQLRGQPLEERSLVLDTILLDANNLVVELVWRASQRVHGRLDDLQMYELVESGGMR